MTATADDTLNIEERTDQLIALLEEQRGCYRQLKQLSEGQRRLITDQNPEALLKVLADRQRLVDRLGELNVSLAPFRREWASTYTQMQPDRRHRVQRVLDDINTLLGSILVTDAEDSRMLTSRREGIREEMKQAATGRMANSAYVSRAYRAPAPTAADHEA